MKKYVPFLLFILVVGVKSEPFHLEFGFRYDYKMIHQTIRADDYLPAGYDHWLHNEDIDIEASSNPIIVNGFVGWNHGIYFEYPILRGMDISLAEYKENNYVYGGDHRNLLTEYYIAYGYRKDISKYFSGLLTTGIEWWKYWYDNTSEHQSDIFLEDVDEGLPNSGFSWRPRYIGINPTYDLRAGCDLRYYPFKDGIYFSISGNFVLPIMFQKNNDNSDFLYGYGWRFGFGCGMAFL